MHPVDGSLDGGIETLHAEARAVDPGIGERVDHRASERTRIDLDGNLGRGKDEEGLSDCSDQIGKGLGRHDRRRSTAEVNVAGFDTVIDLTRYQIDFAAQGRRIDSNRLVTAGNRCVATVIPAHRPAERDVQIE